MCRANLSPPPEFIDRETAHQRLHRLPQKNGIGCAVGGGQVLLSADLKADFEGLGCDAPEPLPEAARRRQRSVDQTQFFSLIACW